VAFLSRHNAWELTPRSTTALHLFAKRRDDDGRT
jgi:hypothetical protein